MDGSPPQVTVMPFFSERDAAKAASCSLLTADIFQPAVDAAD